jgi:hypothetical protein
LRQNIQGDCGVIRCVWENLLRNSRYFTLLEDNSHNVDGTKNKYFTRVFGLQLGKALTTYRITFIYDYNTKIATVSCDNIALQAISIESRKEVIDEEKLNASITKVKEKNPNRIP